MSQTSFIECIICKRMAKSKCRRCGESVCEAHASHRVKVKKGSERLTLRVCDPCYSSLSRRKNERKTKSRQDMLPAENVEKPAESKQDPRSSSSSSRPTVCSSGSESLVSSPPALCCKKLSSRISELDSEIQRLQNVRSTLQQQLSDTQSAGSSSTGNGAATLREEEEDEAYEYCIQGNIHLKNEKFDEACSAFQQALLIDPEDPSIWLLLAKSFMGMRRYDKAIGACEESLDLEDSSLASALLDELQQFQSNSDIL